MAKKARQCQRDAGFFGDGTRAFRLRCIRTTEGLYLLRWGFQSPDECFALNPASLPRSFSHKRQEAAGLGVRAATLEREAHERKSRCAPFAKRFVSAVTIIAEIKKARPAGVFYWPIFPSRVPRS